MHVKVAFAVLTLALVFAEAKPSHPFGFHGIPDHLDLVPPVLPPAHFHAADPAPLLPFHHHETSLLPAPLPAPAHFLPPPVPFLHAPVPFIAAHAPLLPAPAPLLPAPVAATPIISPVLETVPLVEPIPTYRAIPGPKTTTHHLSVGYAFPQSRFPKLHTHVHQALPFHHHHAHLHASPLALAHHHHHTLF